MHRRVIYQALAWAPIAAGAAIGFGTTSHQVVNKTVVYDDQTTYAQTPTPAVVAMLAVDARSAMLVNKTIIYEENAYAPPYAVTQVETVTVDKWWRQLDIPVRRKIVTAEEGSVFGSPPRIEANDAVGWHRPLDWPTRRRLITEGAYSAAPAKPEANDAVGWYRDLALPTRRKLITEGFYSAAPPKPEARDQVAWWRDLDIPMRAKRLPVLAGLSFTAAAPGAGTEYNWFSGLDLPTRLRRSLQTELGWVYFLPAAGEEVTVDKWWMQLDLPVRRKTITAEEGSIFGSPPRPEANDQTAWHRQLDWPTRRKVVVEGAYSASPPKPEANDQIGFYRPLDGPTWRKQVVQYLQPESLDALPRTPWGFYTPLEAPTRAKRLPQGVIPGEVRNPLTVVPWGWYAELDKPTRLVKTPSNQVGYTFVAAAPGSATAQQTWHQLDIPTRARRLYEFPATAIPTYFVPATAGPGNELNWWPPLDEPIRPRLSIKTAQQQGLTIAPRLLTTTLENAWHQRLSEPVRLKVTFGKYPGGTVQGNINPIIPYVLGPLDTPTRLRVSFQAPAAYGNYTPVVVVAAEILTPSTYTSQLITKTVIYEDFALSYYVPAQPGPGVAYNWFQQLDTPVRRDYRRVAAQLGLVHTRFIAKPGPGVAYNWFQSLDTPMRRDQRRVAVQQFRAYGNFTPPRAFLGAFSRTAYVFRRAIIFDPTAIPPTGVEFPVFAGPADEDERVICVPDSSREATAPELLRLAVVPVQQRSASPPELLRVATVPEGSRVVDSNDYRDRPCHDT